MRLSPELLRRIVRTARVSLTLFGGFMLLNILLRVGYYWGEPNLRLLSDWKSLNAAAALRANEPPESAYARAFERARGVDDIRTRIDRDLARGDAVIDVASVRLIEARAGQVDARSIPPGVYIAASAMGPDTLLMAAFSQYLVFPRHGYVLVVPPGEPAQAIQAAASIESEFVPDTDRTDDIYAIVTPFNGDANNYPTIGEPIHDLVLVTSDAEVTRRVYHQLPAVAERLQRADVPYRFLQRNSNAALACLLLASGVPPRRVEALRGRALVALRLPGIELQLWDEPNEHSLPECTVT